MSVPDGNPWDWISAGMWQHRNSQALISSWDELWFSKGWIRRGYPGSCGAAGLGMGKERRSKVWRSSYGNSLPSKVAFPAVLGMLGRREWCRGVFLCSIPNRSSCTLSLEFWNSDLLLPSHALPFSRGTKFPACSLRLSPQGPCPSSGTRQESSDVGIPVGNFGPRNGTLFLSQLQVRVLNSQLLAPERKVFVESHRSTPKLFHSQFPWEVGNVHPQHLLDDLASLDLDPWA